MGFYLWVEVVCRECASTTAGRHVSAVRLPRREFAQEARKNGWHLMGDEWFCPRCVHNRYEASKDQPHD